MTPRLYYDDPLLLSFEARVLGWAELGGRPSVLLEHSAFYPESGGQMADRGTLGGLPILDVQVDDAGDVHHVVDGERPAPGAVVRGEIDRARRRLHMALHTGQHMLSRALVDVAGLETVSSRLGETQCTIDVDRDAVAEGRVAAAEDLVNAVVEDDRPVRAFFPDADELSRLPLRRKPKVTENIRVVDVGGFDVSPCGGTHCTRTSQVGLVHVSGIERYKGKLRVSFAAGRRAARELSAEHALLGALARDLTCGPSDVATAIDKLRRELSESRESAGHLRARLAELEGAALLARLDPGVPYAVATLDGASVEQLRALASKVTSARPDAVALLSGRGVEGQSVLVARGAESAFDCGAFLKRVAAEHGGRGGGRAERAEGRMPASVAWDEAVARALATQGR